jgi:CMP-N,N'-diacetyllegionaminic acid synthase
MKEKILCVICCRAGSKGLKNKNILSLAGKPLIALTIGQALKWSRAAHVVVSTDSEKIASVAKKYGAEVPFLRPKILAQDNTPKVPVIRHALVSCEKIFREKYDIIVDLDATSPIRSISDLEKSLELFRRKKPKSLFSVVHASKNPYFNMVEETSSGYFKLSKFLNRKITSRQAAPKVYSLNASIYFYARDFLLDNRNTTPISDKSIAYIMDELSRYDIDSALDFKFLEFLTREKIWRPDV